MKGLLQLQELKRGNLYKEPSTKSRIQLFLSKYNSLPLSFPLPSLNIDSQKGDNASHVYLYVCVCIYIYIYIYIHIYIKVHVLSCSTFSENFLLWKRTFRFKSLRHSQNIEILKDQQNLSQEPISAMISSDVMFLGPPFPDLCYGNNRPAHVSLQ